jgi:hypothetical protein
VVALDVIVLDELTDGSPERPFPDENHAVQTGFLDAYVDGGPLIHGWEEAQRSFDSTCRKLHRFLSNSALSPRVTHRFF